MRKRMRILYIATLGELDVTLSPTVKEAPSGHYTRSTVLFVLRCHWVNFYRHPRGPDSRLWPQVKNPHLHNVISFWKKVFFNCKRWLFFFRKIDSFVTAVQFIFSPLVLYDITLCNKRHDN
jgi:hypothetical protein